MMSKLRLALFLASAVSMSACAAGYAEGPVEGEVVVQAPAPPAPQVEVRPVAPWGEAVWVEGYWRWNGAEYVWIRGHWEHARRGWVWVPHHWVRHHRGWRYIPGHWRRA